MTCSDRYLALMGRRPKHIPHWEHWSCPDAETFITGIDYYEHPRLCREKMLTYYAQLNLPVPESDDPVPLVGTIDYLEPFGGGRRSESGSASMARRIWGSSVARSPGWMSGVSPA